VHLADTAGDITASYNYDGYGRALDFSPTNADTSLLYTGEMYDQQTQQYYLRARWYSPATGRFNRMDPFAGNNRDPQSLHKYLYAHNNPVNGIDPTGTFFIGLLLTIAVFAIILTIASVANPDVCGPDVTKQLESLEDNIVSWFDPLPLKEKIAYCVDRWNIGQGWDIHQFKPDHVYGTRREWPEGCATGKDCKDTVKIGRGCYSSHEANYYLFGVMTRLCGDYLLYPASALYTYAFWYEPGNRPRCKRAWIRAGIFGNTNVSCGNTCFKCSTTCKVKFEKLKAQWRRSDGHIKYFESD